MPRRDDIKHILVIGSGPIVIGQACEFDYSGTQACRVLRSEGIRVSLINSNPATIMTDPEFADATYIEPITPAFVEKVLADQRDRGFPVDAVLATLGGQTALNTAIAMDSQGILDRFGVELIGADIPAIQRGEDRQIFKDIVRSVGGDVPRSAVCHSMDEVRATAQDLGLPVVIRPSFTMGGLGSGMAYTPEDLDRIAGTGLAASPVTEVLIEESVLGWKEFELELMRDSADNAVVVCSIENIDPMGVHTGDSVTVAPAMTLTDREYQRMRDLGLQILRAVGVATGGCNIQFAIDPDSGRMIVIEMNPRVSRSSALASKATGFPIAKIAAKLAIGYTLDEIANDITTLGGTPPESPPRKSTLGGTPPESPPRKSTLGGTPPESPPRESALGGTPPESPPRKSALGGTPPESPPRKTSAAFEPALDYVVVKIPRFAFEKFPGADPVLTTTMKSVGEAMSFGRSFAEAFGKALRSMETKASGYLLAAAAVGPDEDRAEVIEALRQPQDGRWYRVIGAIRAGISVEAIHEATDIDPWFLDQIALVTSIADEVAAADSLGADLLRRAKRYGLSDADLAQLRAEAGDAALGAEAAIRALRTELGVHPVFFTVDTCAAEFEATTPYHYSAYEIDPLAESEVAPQTERPKVIILGSGPNRIGQGIEFDYSCVHAALSLRDAGFETVMVNCNPETVSTDYDTSDRLYFEPLTIEDVLEVVASEQRSGTVAGVIVTLGGQTPLKLAAELKASGVPILGTQPEAIDLAEDRKLFGDLLTQQQLPAPAFGTAISFEGARDAAARIGYPVLVRPSFVLGGRGMEIVYDEQSLSDYIDRATEIAPDRPVLVDRFLDDAIEIDVDALCDGTEVYLGGVMEHIEEAGVHSGDSACVLPPITLGRGDIAKVREHTTKLALGIGVRGLMNVQYALKGETLYVLEANPRASRTVPFSSKATAVQLAKAAARIMTGSSIAELRAEGLLPATGDGGQLPPGAPVAVKEAVMQFHRFRRPDGRGVDSLLGPEMRSTGEVMGIDSAFGPAFAKSQTASYGSLPTAGTVFVSVANADKRSIVFPAKRLADLGFEILATEGTAEMLRRNGMEVETVGKYFESTDTEGDLIAGVATVDPAAGDSVVHRIRAGQVDLVINTPYGNSGPRIDGYEIRTAAVAADIPCITTISGAAAAIQGIEALIRSNIGVAPLQELHKRLRFPAADQPEPAVVGV
ncbi:carbamoyl-phosphate synthase large subunit [Nakamurella sp. A5-74]|uniref:Carbamoyl phosphate synthase large chain n=1 Tax=Nakamurella sp. A5-74 TaxID=3158264 RepID=A0AAU8DMA3_9ACTN